MPNLATETAARQPRRMAIRDSEAGREVVRAPLSDGRYVTFDAFDFDRLAACGLRFDLYAFADQHGAEHVRAVSATPDRHPVIDMARLVMGAGPGQRVLFRDSGRLDLRRTNLVLSARKAGHANTNRSAT